MIYRIQWGTPPTGSDELTDDDRYSSPVIERKSASTALDLVERQIMTLKRQDLAVGLDIEWTWDAVAQINKLRKSGKGSPGMTWTVTAFWRGYRWLATIGIRA